MPYRSDTNAYATRFNSEDHFTNSTDYKGVNNCGNPTDFPLPH
jgi:hypothetical protein